ncbi:MAG: ATP-binding cassette domain-containing protein [Rhizobiales bacterium]|nr:ATP-binding cassette domain-containing protein [Hyphomicrobiales bacterium]
MNEGEGLVADGLTVVHPDFTATYDLAVPRGAFCALIGPSGGGKTTLLNTVAGFEAIARGTLRFGGVDLAPLAPAARPATALFQDHNLFAHLDVTANVAIGVRPDLRLDEGQRAEVAQALARVGLAGKERRRPADLSGGERQRVALARALVRDRPLLLLDEPFAALDPGLRRDMIALVDALRRERGATVLLSLHTPTDMLGHADLAAFIAEGRAILVDSPARALAGGLDPRLDAYLGLT